MTASKIVAAAASGVGGAGLDVNEVFSTFVYDGTGSAQAIENGIALGNSNDGGSAVFSGTSANTSTRVNIPTSSNFNFGTGDFTIEAFINLKTSKNYHNVYDQRTPTQDVTTNSPIIYIDSNNYINYFVGGSGRAFSSALSLGVWYHVAVTRASGSTKLFLNGTQQGSTYSDSLTYVQPASDFSFGGSLEQNNYNFDGFISNLRVVKGTALYTSNFTAPTAELTAVSGTSLLTAQGSTPFVDNSGNSVALTLNNSPVASEFGPFTGTDGEGGLVWIKGRNGAKNHRWFDSARGVSNGYISSNLYNAENFESDQLTAFNSNGFSIGGNTDVNHSASNNDNFVSWTFRKAKKFFDVVTYTGNGSVRTIAHNLGSTPGMIIIKRRDASQGGGWTVFHRSTTDTDGKRGILLNTDDQQYDYSGSTWDVSEMSSTHFGLGSANDINGQDRLYVAYIFAHNNSDGGFGPDGDQDIIKCASYTGNGGSTETGSPLAEINLGFEPQWLMIKRAEGGTEDWIIIDNIRGFDVNIVNKPILKPNTSEAESSSGSKVVLTSSGFKIEDTDNRINGNNNKYIYMAIRRGSLNTPEDATDVFDVDMYTGGQAVDTNFDSAGFPADMLLHAHRIDTVDNQLTTRLTNKIVVTNKEDAEIGTDYVDWDNNSGWVTGAATSGNTWRISSGTDKHVVYAWKRAPGYFDVSCYTGTGVYGLAVNHNLGVVPEMMWVKQRNSNNDDWFVYHSALGNTKWLELNENTAEQTHQAAWNNTSPTATQFTVGAWDGVNGSSSATYVAMLFATVAGVSKVGSYTGNGGTQNIDCGFSSGARFVLFKRTDTAGSWHFFDTSRGIVSGNDPVLQLNNNQNENSNDDYIDPYSSGFSVASASLSNASGGSYIFYAIA